jgi:hypothetical protein
MLHNQPLPNDCYRVSIDQSLVDAACIPNVGNNGFKTVVAGLGRFFAWPKDQVVLDHEEVHTCVFSTYIYIILHI